MRRGWKYDTFCMTTRPTLSKEVQGELASRIDRTKAETDQLIEGNLKLVASLAAKYFHGYQGKVPYEDIFQAGCMGLMMAAKKFEPSNGASFVTYAYGGIKLYVRRECTRRRGVVFTPPAGSKLTVGTSRMPPVVHRNVFSLDEQGGVIVDSHYTWTMRTTTGTAFSWDFAYWTEPKGDSVEYREELAIVWRLIEETLPARYKTVLKSRLAGGTLKEAADLIGVTKERARQMQVRATEHMRRIQKGVIPCQQLTDTRESARIAKSTAACR